MMSMCFIPSSHVCCHILASWCFWCANTELPVIATSTIAVIMFIHWSLVTGQVLSALIISDTA